MLDKLKIKFNSSYLLKDSSISFLIRIIGMILGYILIMIISNYYGAEALGIYSLSFVYIQMMAMISRLGMDTAIVKFTAEFNEKKDFLSINNTYFLILKIVLPVSITLSIIGYFLSPYIASMVFNKDYLTYYFQISSFIILAYVFIFIHSEFLRGLHKIKEFMYLQNIYTTGFGLFLIILFLYFFEKNIEIPLITLLVSIFITFLISTYIIKRNISNLNKKNRSKMGEGINLKKLLTIALPLTFTSYLTIIIGSTDVVMLGMFSDEKYVGIYSVVNKLSTSTLIVFMAVSTITIPKISALWGKKDINEIDKLNKKSTELIILLSLPIFIIIWVFTDEILGLFGSEFVEGSKALLLMSFGQFLLILAGPVWHMMNMTNKQKVFFYFSLLSALVNIILNYYLIPKYNIVGAAIGTFSSVVFLNILSIIYIKKSFGLLTLYIPFKKEINV